MLSAPGDCVASRQVECHPPVVLLARPGWRPRFRQQLVNQDPLQQLFVSLGKPVAVCDQQSVHLGGHKHVNDVRSVALSHFRPRRARERYPPLALLSLSRVVS
jgi:hypothetical protein